MNQENVATRLKLFMDYMGLSHSQFADSCAIPRPTLSQLLSGRNKKISDILVGQIHHAFPSLSILWLLFGEGEMVMENIITPSNEVDPIADDSIFADDSTGADYKSKEMGLESSPTAGELNGSQLINGLDTRYSRNDQKIGITKNPRKVIQITVYYDDSTFETFVPEIK